MSMNTFELDKTYIAGTYKRFPVQIVSGKGSVVKDENGKEYIDLGSGIAVTSFGVADDVWRQAVIDQIGIGIPHAEDLPLAAHHDHIGGHGIAQGHDGYTSSKSSGKYRKHGVEP